MYLEGSEIQMIGGTPEKINSAPALLKNGHLLEKLKYFTASLLASFGKSSLATKQHIS